MIKYNLERADLVAGEIAPNIDRHMSEVIDGKIEERPNIDWDAYIQGGQNNICWVVTARDDGKLIGYSIYELGYNPRHKHILEAFGNGIFIEKPYRGKVGRAILKHADEYLARLGVKETSYMFCHDLLGKLLERNGYKSTYKVWSVKYE